MQYFPLYFLDVLGLSPIHVAALFFVSPLVTAAFTFGVTALARRIGRAEAALLSYALGTGCLFAVAALPPSVALLPLFVVRSALMNCTTPIARSILMDCVAREDRGKWNALESIMSASWSGSAVLGGFLSDWRGYRFCFLVTACVYAAACGVFAVALVPLVPREVPEDFGEEDDE